MLQADLHACDVIHVLLSASGRAVDTTTTIGVHTVSPRAWLARFGRDGAVDGDLVRTRTTVRRAAQERSVLRKGKRREDPLLRAAGHANRARAGSAGGVGCIAALFTGVRPAQARHRICCEAPHRS